jgi:hypothetical protein
MIFALATDDNGLMIFATEVDAVAYCEGIDVAEGGWEFFAADGTPLEPVFEQPASRSAVLITSGKYTLRTSGKTLPSLIDRIGIVTSVEGMPGLVSVADVKRALTAALERRESSMSNPDTVSRSSSAPHAPSEDASGSHGLSLVRVKMWSIHAVFITCWLYLFLGGQNEKVRVAAFAIMFVLALVIFLVRCEKCGRPEIQTLFWKRTGNPYLPNKHCPNCGIERV